MEHQVKTLRFLPLLILAFLMISLVGPLNARAAGSEHIAVAAPHFFRPPVFSKNSQHSVNWSGYAAISGHYTMVSSSWTEPTVTCGSTNSFAALWVGLDGDGSGTVEQTGSDSDCLSGSPTYYAWYEIFPNLPVAISAPVHPGDAMSASVTAGPQSSFKLFISDSTQGWKFQTIQTLWSAKLASAEAIAEVPSSQSGVLRLADFGTVNFSSTMVNGESLGSFHPQEIVMATRGGTVKAQPSALSGTAFSVTWEHS